MNFPCCAFGSDQSTRKKLDWLGVEVESLVFRFIVEEFFEIFTVFLATFGEVGITADTVFSVELTLAVTTEINAFRVVLQV